MKKQGRFSDKLPGRYDAMYKGYRIFQALDGMIGIMKGSSHISWAVSVDQAKVIVDALTAAEKNPRPRLGTKKPTRKSQVTKKKPSARLVARREKNAKRGYFPNPLRSDGVSYTTFDEAKNAAIKLQRDGNEYMKRAGYLHYPLTLFVYRRGRDNFLVSPLILTSYKPVAIVGEID